MWIAGRATNKNDWKQHRLNEPGFCPIPGQSCEPKLGRGPTAGCSSNQRAAAGRLRVTHDEPTAEPDDEPAKPSDVEPAEPTADVDKPTIVDNTNDGRNMFLPSQKDDDWIAK